MKRLFLVISLTAWLVVGLNAKGVERRQLLDANWQFALDDSTKWRPVDLPHDWSIEGTFSKDAPAGSAGAYLPTGRGWYRKTLTLGKEYQGKRLRLYFEGVYMNAEVSVNGHRAGGHPYGYSAFFVDVTPYVNIKGVRRAASADAPASDGSGRNVIEVRVDNSQQVNCRWYTGSGIYRHVWLLTTPMAYIDEWSITTDTRDRHHVVVKGDVVGEDGQRQTVSKTVDIDQPRLWSPDDPYLYHTTLEAGGDAVPVTFGIRTIEYSAQRGFLLNGQPLLLNGGCVHHDNGILGAAAYDAADYRRVRLLKEAGFNAVRTSHNVPSEGFLRACDELGMLVIDEAFDGWRDKKNPHDYHTLIDQWWQEDVKAMVLRDRLHPSIFCWSTGNEVIERKHIGVIKTAHQLASLCRELDHERRPVTSALCAWDSDWDIYDPLAAEHDIVGYNYMIFKHQGDHERVPNRVMMQTESYPRDVYSNYRTVKDHSYIIGDFVWTAIDYLGESGIGRWFYEGEVTGESWQNPMFPNHAAYCGDIDLTGLRKPISHRRSMLWNKDGEHLYMAVREPDGYLGTVNTTQWSVWPTYESWNWEGSRNGEGNVASWVGKPVTVEVYSHYPEVRLSLNEQVIEQHAVKDGMTTFTLPYQPGTLVAEGLEGGTVRESVSLKTAGTPAAIKLTPDGNVDDPALFNRSVGDLARKTSQDLLFVTVELQDAAGLCVPDAANRLTATVSGPARLLAFGNADIKDCDSYVDNSHRLWKGRALLVLRSNGRRGTVRLTVSGDGLRPATLTVPVR